VQDEILQVAYDYPTRFGSYTSLFRDFSGSPVEAGHLYEYEFVDPRLEAGGCSLDFSAPREAFITDFRGFGGDSPEDLCERYGASICTSVSDRVVFMILMPEAEVICQGYAFSFFYPLSLVAIDLPDNPQINGFIFAERFLSGYHEEELYAPLGGLGPSGPACDAAAQQAFDTRVEEMAARLRFLEVDEETIGTMQSMEHLTRFITPLE